jgi:hypothetical protein
MTAAALALLFGLGACGVREEGLTIDVAAAVAPPSTPLSLADGSALSITEATLLVSSVELMPCPSTAAKAWRWLSPLGIAWAHGATTGKGPLTLSIAAPVDLAAPGTQALGKLRPPPGRFCRLVARLGASDPDGGALTTLHVAGRAGPTSLTLDTTEARPLTLDYAALAVDEDTRAAALTLHFDLGRALAGVDPSSPGAAGQVLSHLARDVRVTHYP